MKAWRFKLKRSPKEVSEKLESELKSIGGFVYTMHRKRNDTITFIVRKRIPYAWYIAFQNWTVVKGELLKTEIENTTDVEITFDQHFLIRFILFIHIALVLGFLVAIVTGISINSFIYVLGGALVVSGIVLWIAIQLKFKKDIQKYKSLISEIFEM